MLDSPWGGESRERVAERASDKDLLYFAKVFGGLFIVTIVVFSAGYAGTSTAAAPKAPVPHPSTLAPTTRSPTSAARRSLARLGFGKPKKKVFTFLGKETERQRHKLLWLMREAHRSEATMTRLFKAIQRKSVPADQHDRLSKLVEQWNRAQADRIDEKHITAKQLDGLSKQQLWARIMRAKRWLTAVHYAESEMRGFDTALDKEAARTKNNRPAQLRPQHRRPKSMTRSRHRTHRDSVSRRRRRRQQAALAFADEPAKRQQQLEALSQAITQRLREGQHLHFLMKRAKEYATGHPGVRAVLESDTELWGKDEAAFRRMKQYLDEVWKMQNAVAAEEHHRIGGIGHGEKPPPKMTPTKAWKQAGGTDLTRVRFYVARKYRRVTDRNLEVDLEKERRRVTAIDSAVRQMRDYIAKQLKEHSKFVSETRHRNIKSFKDGLDAEVQVAKMTAQLKDLSHYAKPPPPPPPSKVGGIGHGEQAPLPPPPPPSHRSQESKYIHGVEHSERALLHGIHPFDKWNAAPGQHPANKYLSDS